MAEFGCLYSEVLLTRNAWEKRKLGDLGSVAMNKRIYKDQTSDEGEIPFYKIGSFGKQADAFISRKLFNEYKKLYPFPKKGDILISASGSIGRTIVYNGEDAYFQDSNIIWIQHDNRLDNTFLHQLFNIIRWSGVEGTTIKRLYNKNILSTQILLPSVEEQRSIGNLLDNVDNLIAATQHNIDALEQAKKALLQRLFDQSWRFKGYSDPWEKRKLGEVATITMGQSP
ncbi:restriction endonuclease subunit S, partial [Lacticaseibacillus paracasei]|uniref:restriction endonuclease subunit S n=1 Tax=Lacticaseibacillus paracasei TaxID=1597 RepID=UPI0022E5DCC3